MMTVGVGETLTFLFLVLLFLGVMALLGKSKAGLEITISGIIGLIVYIFLESCNRLVK